MRECYPAYLINVVLESLENIYKRHVSEVIEKLRNPLGVFNVDIVLLDIGYIKVVKKIYDLIKKEAEGKKDWEEVCIDLPNTDEVISVLNDIDEELLRRL